MRSSFLSDEFQQDPFFRPSAPTNRVKQQEQTNSTEESETTCNIFDVPLITVNKMVFRSKLEKGAYKPLDFLSYANLLKQLRQSRTMGLTPTQTRKRTISENQNQKSPSQHFMKKLQERKRSTTQVEEAVPPHPHPFNRNRRNTEQFNAKTLTARSVLLEMSDEVEENYEFESSCEDNEKYNELERKFENFMKWVNQAKQDYVAMETVNSIDEFQILFKLLEKYTSPTLLQIKPNSNGTWTVVCQPLEDFKKDFMVLRIGLKYCLCLEPF